MKNILSLFVALVLGFSAINVIAQDSSVAIPIIKVDSPFQETPTPSENPMKISGTGERILLNGERKKFVYMDNSAVDVSGVHVTVEGLETNRRYKLIGLSPNGQIIYSSMDFFLKDLGFGIHNFRLESDAFPGVRTLEDEIFIVVGDKTTKVTVGEEYQLMAFDITGDFVKGFLVNGIEKYIPIEQIEAVVVISERLGLENQIALTANYNEVVAIHGTANNDQSQIRLLLKDGTIAILDAEKAEFSGKKVRITRLEEWGMNQGIMEYGIFGYMDPKISFYDGLTVMDFNSNKMGWKGFSDAYLFPERIKEIRWYSEINGWNSEAVAIPTLACYSNGSCKYRAYFYGIPTFDRGNFAVFFKDGEMAWLEIFDWKYMGAHVEYPYISVNSDTGTGIGPKKIF